MSLTSLSRYDDAEDEIKDEDHGLQTIPKETDLNKSLNTSDLKPGVLESFEKENTSYERPNEEPTSRPSSTTELKPRGLVSYDGEDSDEDVSSDNEESRDVKPSKTTNSTNLAPPSNFLLSAASNSPSLANDTTDQNDTTDEIFNIRLPPEPQGRCSKSLQEKVARMIEKKNNGLNVNESIQGRKDFRNPSIYEKLLSFIDIDEHGTNFPKRIYDPSIWGPESYYDNLSKVQKEYHEKKEKEKILKRTSVEFVSAVKKSDSAVDKNAKSEKSGPEKKSKWDQKVPIVLAK